MPSRDKHVEKFKDNHAFLGSCETLLGLPGTHACWHVVIRFYVCVHIVEAILATISADSHDHSARRANILDHSDLFDTEFQNSYFYLYDSSIIARYHGKVRLNPNRLSDVEKRYRYILHYAMEKHGIAA